MMSKKEKKEERKEVSYKEFEGKQVVDASGTLVGSVKDLTITAPDGKVSLLISTKEGGESKIAWSDIKSVGDVILLNKEVKLPKPPAPTLRPMPSPPSPAPTTLNCPSCKARIPARAKFCPRCGSKVK